MKYVLDSNVALKWVLQERDSDKARQLRIDYLQQVHELLAPDVFPIEIAHALARSERRGIITPAQGPTFLARILASQPRLHPYVPPAVASVRHLLPGPHRGLQLPLRRPRRAGGLRPPDGG